MKKHLTIACNFIVLFLIIGITSCKDDEVSRSNLTGIISFGLQEYQVTFTLDESALTISNIGADSLPYQTDVSALRANFEAIDLTTVTVNDVEQISGVTVNDFSSPVTYTVLAEDGITEKNYTVTVNVSQIDPETVSWNRIANEQWTAYQVSRATAFGGKLWFFGFTGGAFGAMDVATYSSSDGGATWALEDAKDDQYNYATDEEGFAFPYGRSISLVTLNGKLWSIGGFLNSRQDEDGNFPFAAPTEDTWSTEDGINWTRNTIVDGYSKREAVSALTFKDKIWVIGGNEEGFFGNLGGPINDVWSSADGTTWTEVSPGADFVARTAPGAVVFNDKMWIIGGQDAAGNLLNDVWSSSDGAIWTQEAVSADFAARRGAGVFAFNGKMFLVGGEGTDGISKMQYADMWVSEDGATWTEVDASDPFALPQSFTGRSNHSVFVNGNEIFMVGGTGPLDENDQTTYYSSVWRGLGVE